MKKTKGSLTQREVSCDIEEIFNRLDVSFYQEKLFFTSMYLRMCFKDKVPLQNKTSTEDREDLNQYDEQVQLIALKQEHRVLKTQG